MFVYNLSFNDPKHLVGIHVSAFDTLVLRSIGMVAFGFEVYHGLRGIPAVDLVPPPIYKYDPVEQHGFISSQRMGIEVFKNIHPDAPLVVAEAAWQYSHHVLAGLRSHRGPILTVANWSGQWPGLVGLLNLNGSLTKMGVEYSTIWTESFTDEFFINGIRQWIREGVITHDIDHVSDLKIEELPFAEVELGFALARKLQQENAKRLQKEAAEKSTK